MLVRCPSCHTTYRVADNVINTPNPTFRCSRCKHMFVLASRSQPRSTGTVDSTRQRPHHAEEKQEELNFPGPPPAKEESKEETNQDVFDFAEPAEVAARESQSHRETEPAEPEPEGPSFSPEEAFRFETDEEPPLLEGEKGPDWSRADEEPGLPRTVEERETGGETTQQSEDEGSFPIPREEPPSFTDSAFDDRSDPEEEWQHSSAQMEEPESASLFDDDRDRPASTVPYLALFGALAVAFALVTLTYQSQPNRIESWIKTVPWLGASVFENSHLRHGITLRSLRPGVQKIAGNREVFVIAGVAVNHNPMSVREVKVEGYIYNTQGTEIDRQIIALGNAISAKIVRDLTAQEISILQRLSPQKRFQIAPEESANFVIVFLKGSGEAKNFSCRVAAAQAAS